METQSSKNQKVIKNLNDELEVKSYPIRKSIEKEKVEKPKINLPFCPWCNLKNWFDFDWG